MVVTEETHQVHEFGPVYDMRSRILILGSFPSVKSREARFYYGHPQNRFWKLLASLFEAKEPESVSEKKQFLLSRGIALWDVIESCDITGSSDGSIRNAACNDIGRIVSEAGIRKVFANGKKAEQLFLKHVAPKTGIDITGLPSTSPANAAYSLDRLKEAWKPVVRWAGPDCGAGPDDKV